MEKFTDIEINNIINTFLKLYVENPYLLTNKQKLDILEEKKILLEADFDINNLDTYTTKDIINRLYVDELAINELNMCIKYLKKLIKEDKKNNSIFNKTKRLVRRINTNKKGNNNKRNI